MKIEVGQATAEVIEDSINTKGERITTLELTYPRYIHAELLTHRMFSRNASSSRATPVSVLIDDVMKNPVFFDFVGKNKSGMVAVEPLDWNELFEFGLEWKALGKTVAQWAYKMNRKYGIHKQTLNRVLEPWTRINTLVTATEWDNFFKLRLAEDAQPEMKSLAVAMRKAMDESTPVERHMHLPYITDDDRGFLVYPDTVRVSVARCARVSYARLDGREHSIADDVALCERLLEAGHMSPFEHVAFAMYGEKYDNFIGWQSYRNWLRLQP